MALRHGCFFGRGGLGGDPAGPVVADASHRGVLDDGVVHISIVNHRGIYVDDRGVVREMRSLPAAADEANSCITVAIVDTPVEADMRAPVAGVEAIHATRKCPVSRRPEEA